MENLPTLVQRQIESTQSGVPDGFVTDENGRFVPFWYTRTGIIIKWSVFLGLMFLFTTYILVGYMHAKRRIRKGLPPLGYHRWLVSRAELARVDPRYAYPQSLYTPYRPVGGGAGGWGPGGPQPYYNMQSNMPPPPPMYDPNGRPPMYDGPTGATKAAPQQQWNMQPPQGPPPPAGRNNHDEEYGAPSGPPPPAALHADHTGASNNPYRA